MSAWDFSGVAEREMGKVSTREVLMIDKAVAGKIMSLRDRCGGSLLLLLLLRR